MAYKKTPLNMENLTLDTKLRFLEIEISQAIDRIETFFFEDYQKRQKAREFIIQSLAPNKPTLQDELNAAFLTKRFQYPTKDERIHYFRYKDLGVHKVAKYTDVAPNTISTYKNKYPNFQPVFPMWITMPFLIPNWNRIKPIINIFQDDMIHTKNSYELFL